MFFARRICVIRMADLELKSLALSNFKGFNGSHVLELGRSPGLYHISGRNRLFPELGANGVGKSTIWDALVWVLFGKTGRDNKPGSAIQPWSGKKNVLVRLEFNRGTTEYTLERSRNPNHLHLWKIGAPHDEERELTQEDIPAILGMSEETFRRTVVLGQFGTLFLDLRPDAQAQMFSEALNLQVWLDAAERANKAGSDAGKLARELISETDSLEAAIKELSTSITDARERSNAFQESMAEKIEQLEEALIALQMLLQRERKHMPSEPDLPKSPKRLIELLQELEAEPDALEEAKRQASRKAGGAKKCSKCGQSVSNDEVQRKYTKLEEASRERVKELHVELKELQQARAAEDKDYQTTLNSYRAKEREVSALMTQEITLLRQLKAAQDTDDPDLAEITRLKERRKSKRTKLGEVVADLEKTQALVDVGSFWAKAFKEIRLGIIDDALVELEVASNRHAVNLGLTDWSIRFETEREAKSGNVSYSFTVLLFPPGEESPIKWESYSGGESQRWQLAVAFALSEVLLSRAGIAPNLEVLDEPTRGLSPEGISDLLEHLRERALELGRAIYLVDHHSLDRGAFDGTLLVTKRSKGSKFKWL